MRNTNPLSDAEAGFLKIAHARRSQFVITTSKEYDVTQAKTKKLINRLIKAKLIEERVTVSVARAWRTDEAGQHYTLRITALGRAALPIEDTVECPKEAEVLPGSKHAGPINPRGKLGAVLTAICRPEGAALDELATLTGWQNHTVRACITRLRQTGFAIAMASTENGKRYVTTAQSTGGTE